jgi:hypothetical protein
MVTISIASRSLTVTDPQPKKTPLPPNTTQDLTKPIPGYTNHVRVHADHDYEHGCQDSFTLYKCCTRSPWVTIILCSRIPVVRMECPYTLLRCALENHYKTFQWFHLTFNVPTEISLLVWALHHTKIPLLCLMGFSHHSFTHTFPRFWWEVGSRSSER